MDRKTIINELTSRSHQLTFSLLNLPTPPIEVLRRLTSSVERLDRDGDDDAFAMLDVALKEICENEIFSDARSIAEEMRFTLDALETRSVTFDYREDRIHVCLTHPDYLELITALRGLAVTAHAPASVQFEVGRYVLSFTVHGEKQSDYRPAVLLDLAEAFELQYTNARRRVGTLDDEERARLERLCIEIESMNPDAAIPLNGIDRLRAATRLPDLFPRPEMDAMLWFYASVKSLAAMAKALLLLGATPIRELTPEPHAERVVPKFAIVEDRGDNMTVRCGLCGETFYTDCTGENCSMAAGTLVPLCPKCGATTGGTGLR